MLTNCLSACAHLAITVSEIERDIGENNGRKAGFFIPPLHSTPPLGGLPSEYRHPLCSVVTIASEPASIDYDRSFEKNRDVDVDSMLHGHADWQFPDQCQLMGTSRVRGSTLISLRLMVVNTNIPNSTWNSCSKVVNLQLYMDKFPQQWRHIHRI